MSGNSSSSGNNTIVKPKSLVSRALSALGFKNAEDMIYAWGNEFFQYMNYGLFPSQPKLEYEGHSEEALNYLELFSLAKPLIKEGSDILEIGCGFGYGAQLIHRQYKPKYLLSMDKASNAIAFANERFKGEAVHYMHENFSDYDAPEEKVDVIYTVESGGAFPNQNHFHKAFRALRKGGVFLVANINPEAQIAQKKVFASIAGFECYKEKDVTPQVIAYLSSDRKRQMLNDAVAKMPLHKYLTYQTFKSIFKEFARLPGSKSFKLLGQKEFYYHFCFIKPR